MAGAESGKKNKKTKLTYVASFHFKRNVQLTLQCRAQQIQFNVHHEWQEAYVFIPTYQGIFFYFEICEDGIPCNDTNMCLLLSTEVHFDGTKTKRVEDKHEAVCTEADRNKRRLYLLTYFNTRGNGTRLLQATSSKPLVTCQERKERRLSFRCSQQVEARLATKTPDLAFGPLVSAQKGTQLFAQTFK